MLGFIASTKQIVQRIAHIHITKINQPLKLFGLCELGSKVLTAKSNFATSKSPIP